MEIQPVAVLSFLTLMFATFYFHFICSALCLFQLHAVVLICGGVGDKTVFCIYDGNKLL